MEEMKLVAATPADAERLVAAMRPESLKNLSFFREPLTVERERQYLEGRHHSGRSVIFVIEDACGSVLGTVGLHEIDGANRTARLGVAIFAAQNRGGGIGSAAIREMLEIGFRQYGLNKVFLKVFADNNRAIQYYEHLGFVNEGVLRQEYLLEDCFRDMAIMSMLKSEWGETRDRR